MDVDGDGDEVLAISLEEHRRLTVELSEAELFGEEENERVVPLAGGLFEAVESLPEQHAVACSAGRRDVANGGLHEATTVVWQGGV